MVRLSIMTLALATCLPATMAHPANLPRNSKFGCGAEPSDDFLAKSEELAAIEKSRASKSEGKVSADIALNSSTITIQTWFHVVAKSKSLSDGYVGSAALKKQLDVMNDNYAPQGIQFSLAGQDWTVNNDWANANNELEMKKALRKGDYKTLNVYFLYTLGGNLGFCYFPTDVTTGSEDFYLDGCEVLYTTAPGGTLANYNEGKTVTHEVGHWFGLMHTFQGGCTGSGDSIADTPAQSSASSGCPTGRDSCPNAAGLDPIHNYMDYSYDSCYEEFTPDQQTRMISMYNTYRA